MKKERRSNIELLRIVAMLFIISFHYVYKSGYEFRELSVNSFIIKTFYMFGELGVNLFILISGYFMINGKFSIKKLICLILEVDFYYMIATLIGQKLGVVEISGIKDYFLMFFPTILNKCWFITAYIIIYILSPYLNILIQNMQKKEYQKLIITLLVLWSIIPTFFGIFYNTTENMLYYSRLIWLIIMYLVGAYLKLYPIKLFTKKRNAFIGVGIAFTVMLVSIIVIAKNKSLFEMIGTTEVAYFWMPNTIPMVILSVCLFEIFLNIKIGSSKMINTMASTTLGIYLIHDGALAPYIWETIFKTKEHLSNSAWKSLVSILTSTIIIFVLGMIIDLLRQKIFCLIICPINDKIKAEKIKEVQK